MILPPVARPHKPSSPPVATAAGLLKYLREVLGKGLERVVDDRHAGRIDIATDAVLRAVLGGFLLGIGSIRGVEDRLRQSPAFRRFVGCQVISDDGMRDVLSRVAHGGLLAALHDTGKRALLRWRAGRHAECELARRLRPLDCSHLTARAVVALDGHETFCTEKTACADCHTRTKTVKRGGKLVQVEERYHFIVVAQHIGVHPATVLDVERVAPGEGEVTAAYRLVARLGRIYGPAVGVVVADALHDHEPFRTACREAGFRSVVRHKREDRQPGSGLKRRLEARRPSPRTKPDGWHRDNRRGYTYAYWVEQEPHSGRRYVEVHRTDAKGGVMTGGCVTDLPADFAPAMAVAIIMEARWWIENTGFHELAGQLNLDRAFVHQGRATGAWAIVLLALLAYNVWQMYLYRHLGLDPKKPRRTWGDLRRDLWESLHHLLRRGFLGSSPRCR